VRRRIWLFSVEVLEKFRETGQMENEMIGYTMQEMS
jgi:hypothetical protein